MTPSEWITFAIVVYGIYVVYVIADECLLRLEFLVASRCHVHCQCRCKRRGIDLSSTP